MTDLKRPPYYRQSLLATSDSCMRRALYSMQDRRRSPGPEAAAGTLVHRTLHKALHHMMEHRESEISVEQTLEIYAEVLTQRDVPAEDVVPISMRAMERGRMALVKWAQMMRISIRNVIEVEHRLYADITLPSGEVMAISGQLDFLAALPPDGALVMDHKSGRARPKQPRDEEKADDGRGLTDLAWAQSLIYAYLVFANYPSVQYVVFREWHLLWGESREVRIPKWKMERLHDLIAARVSLLDQAVSEGEESPRWVASGGSHCAMCAGPLDCPIADQIGAVYDVGTALAAFNDWQVSGERRKLRATFLKGYVDVNGPLPLPSGKMLGWDPNGKRSFGIYDGPGDDAGVLAE